MAAALIWLIIGIVLMIAEVISGDFVLIMLGIGALLGAGSEALTGNIYIDVAVFALSSVGLLALARPALKRRFLSGSAIPTGIDALVGARAVVVSTVDYDAGQVKIGGEVWSARAVHESQPPIAPGTSVTVVEISGATAVVDIVA
ncbi:NfeD family protein [Amycolatopsis echigonensis]|uniref:Membrane protein implicated in regulation of membrane protease activity n=1 Tax=Amycolatopsis echigonensis TaxID=2576905 RepID=A0A2N3WU00_9PSEU|nr:MULTISPECIES: NfeD family protein [Amycolatopsis]MBB2501762.1 NfeD family protein [Amycolatopsis echigonensis]PKV97356.1 membrane protein implicated in regulation of membrane protease activity [Amycolatopsis niigatensis]